MKTFPPPKFACINGELSVSLYKTETIDIELIILGNPQPPEMLTATADSKQNS